MVTGTVTDAASSEPVVDVVVTATSPSLQGQQIVVTDEDGFYRIPQLPSGDYTLRFDKESYRPYVRSEVRLRGDTTTRVNIEMLPSGDVGQEDIVVIGKSPTVDVGSSSTGVNVSADFIENVAVVRPGGSGTRSFESLAAVAPGAHGDLYGVSIAGTTSPENQFLIDGLSVNDPGFGINATPMTVEFVKEANVITGGYMPEYGRATGGIMNVTTETGSNEFHGSVFANWTPGALEGDPRLVRTSTSALSSDTDLWNLGDIGFDIGGPIMKDKLWFYAGVAPSFSRNRLQRNLNRFFVDENFCYQRETEDGTPLAMDASCNITDDYDGVVYRTTEQIAGTAQDYFADTRTLQYMGKLTYLINSDHNLSLSVLGTPEWLTGTRSVTGDPNRDRHATNNSTDVSAKLSSSFLDKRFLVDVTAGWHHQTLSTRSHDGSGIYSESGLATLPTYQFVRTGDGTLTLGDLAAFEPGYFGSSAVSDVCNDPSLSATEQALICSVNGYAAGGPGYLEEGTLNRWQGKAVGTYLLEAAGNHVIKVGIDAEATDFDHSWGYSGGRFLSENGPFVLDRGFGFYTSPDTFLHQPGVDAYSASSVVGGFIQDSWNILDLVTLNVGLRYDTQTLRTGSETTLVLGNQLSPRLGLVYDFTQEGRSKLYANYARFYQNAVLSMIDRMQENSYIAFQGGQPYNAACDPFDTSTYNEECIDQTYNFTQAVGYGGAVLNQDYYSYGLATPVDPDLKAQSSDEIVVGGEYEVINNGRVGAQYTKRYLNSVVEDMSRDNANTYLIANPGEGIVKDFPFGRRDYDAVTVFFDKAFADLWLAQVSYTWSQLTGNYAGLFRPETGQLNPNINSDFDLPDLMVNRDGFLPGDRTHSFKVFGAKTFVLGGGMSFNVGLSLNARSGTPLNAFGRHPLYGLDEVFIVPRGEAGRLPWYYTADGNLNFHYNLTEDNKVSLSVDVFNMFNFQNETSRSQRFTAANVAPIPEGTCGTDARCSVTDIVAVDHDANAATPDVLEVAGSGYYLQDQDGALLPASARNPAFGNTNQYQTPRRIRFGVKVTF